MELDTIEGEEQDEGPEPENDIDDDSGTYQYRSGGMAPIIQSLVATRGEY